MGVTLLKDAKLLCVTAFCLMLCNSCSDGKGLFSSGKTSKVEDNAFDLHRYCSSVFNDVTQLFQISPDGNFLIAPDEAASFQSEAREKYQVYKIKAYNNIIPLKLSFETKPNYQTRSYSWTAEGSEIWFPLFYKNKTGIYHTLNLETGIKSRIKDSDINTSMRRLEGRTSPTLQDHYALQDHVLFNGWRSNIYGENTLRVKTNNRSKINILQTSAHKTPTFYNAYTYNVKGVPIKNPVPPIELPAIDIYKFSPDNTLTVFSPDYLRSTYNRTQEPLRVGKEVSHFYFVSDSGRNHSVLLRYDNTKEGGKVSLVFSPEGEFYGPISFSRNGIEPYWVQVNERKPDYYFFNGKAESLFNLINQDQMHSAEITSMDRLGRLAIIKRISTSNALEYLIVDTKKKKNRVLSSCPQL